MNNKAVLLRSVSALATAAASTTGAMSPAAAQVLSATTDGYYYSVTGGMKLTKSERFLAGIEDKVGMDGPGADSGGYFSGGTDYSSYTYWSSFSDSESSGLDEFAGMFGSVSFGKGLAPGWDVRGTVSLVDGGTATGYSEAWREFSSYTTFSGSSFDGDYSGYAYFSGFTSGYASGSYSFGYAAGDIEFGYTPILNDSFSVRLFSGLRGMLFTSKFEGAAGLYDYGSSYYYQSGGSEYEYGSGYSSFYNSFSGLTETSFFGAGPRLGVQAATKFEGTPFGISGSLAGSVLFGKQKVSYSGYTYMSYSGWYSGYSSTGGSFSGSGSSYDSGYVSGSEETDKTVVDLEASVGLDYYLNDNAALTIGYQVEKIWQVDGDDVGPMTEIDTLSHGAFVKLTGSF